MAKKTKRPKKLVFADVAREVRRVIDDVIAAGTPTEAEWIAARIMRNHPRGAATDFYYVCTSVTVRNEVHKQLRGFKEQPETDPQLVLPGYNRLQQGYLCERRTARGKITEMLVPITAMTRDEGRAKCLQYQAMGDGCYEHSDELARYFRLDVSEPKAA